MSWLQFYGQNIAVDHNINKEVLRVTATDLDSGDNAVIFYSLEARPTNPDDVNYFEINRESGFISLKEELSAVSCGS